jgi:hypothetical protein
MAFRALTARIVTTNGRTWWRCPACGRTMGEVDGGVVVVKSGDRVLVLTIGAGVSQRCPNHACGAWSRMDAEAA